VTGGEWTGDGSVSLVRPYAMVRGRTHVRHNVFDLAAFVVSLVVTLRTYQDVMPEHQQLVDLCRRPVSVGELVAHVGLPLGVVRVLLGDLLDMGVIRVGGEDWPSGRPSTDLIREVLAGLHAL
jgi:hypothetical protein